MMMKHARKRLQGERGQALMLIVGIFTVTMVVGVITVDFGLWFGERRGAQTDADLSSLAGAQEYEKYLALGCSYPGGQSAADAAAVDKANIWFSDNNESGNASLPTPIAPTSPPCGTFGVSPCVKVTVKHDTKALFTSIFGLGPNNIGTDAKACAGASSGPGGDVPIEIASTNDPCYVNGQPNYGALCLLESGSGACPSGPATPTPAPTPVPCNPHGLLDLQAASPYCSDANGSGNISNVIANGATGTCNVNAGNTCNPTHNGPWYDCVAVQTGNSAQVINGFTTRISRQGACDDGPVDGVESFTETLNLVSGSPPTGLYDARVCPLLGFWDSGKISPRIIIIIVLDTNPAAGNTGYPIRAKAAFYFAGCWDDRNGTPSVSQLDKNCTSNIPPGHTAIYGQFVNLIVTGGDVVPPDPSSTLFGVHLTE